MLTSCGECSEIGAPCVVAFDNLVRQGHCLALEKIV
jgi:hypothetical protein